MPQPNVSETCSSLSRLPSMVGFLLESSPKKLFPCEMLVLNDPFALKKDPEKNAVVASLS